jgi:para-aminobenzoate synthetase component I
LHPLRLHKMKEQFPYSLLNKHQISSQMNYLGALGIPFLFVIDYRAEYGYLIKEDELDERFVYFQSQESRVKSQELKIKSKQIEWEIKPISLAAYKHKFNFVQQQIHQGNSFLTNLTQPTEIFTNLSLLDLFQLSSAKYKLWISGQFTVLSPETFVQIHAGEICSFPMKGTIDAAIPNAVEIILNDPKEQAEHATIVDLIRNDLSLVADHVEVKRYRYIDKLTTNKKDLLQVSSEICGKLPENYLERLGDILFSLLPAGSISGAPKPKTLEIIQEAEGYNRGFYTGICGWFDGENLDSAVMIRFIEQQGERLIFKSGGGITAKSELNKEYEELIQKVYVPIF